MKTNTSQPQVKQPNVEQKSSDAGLLNVRPPVIVVMGHIDHGKSTLLDYIRKANVTGREAGGITQHVGAYEAIFKDKAGSEHSLTFIDTPGHEAFGAIRTCGAQIADIAILVVSAEDGVKPQTLEALACIKRGNIPFVIAINKIDRPGVDIERTKGNLAEHEIYVEGYGGDISYVPVSAITGAGIQDLLELLVLVAQLKELQTDHSKPATGAIIEAHVDQRRGTTTTLIIKDGTLTIGTFLVSGDSFAPVRAIEDYAGKPITSASAGQPVRIVGWSKLPKTGEEFHTVSSKKEAEAEASKNTRQTKNKALWTAEDENVTPNHVTIPLVLKADTSGSLDAVKHEVAKIKVEGISFKTILEGVGTISENDVKTAVSSPSGMVLGFNVKTDASAKAIAERANTPIENFDIIYRLTEWLQAESEKRRPRIEVEEETGRAKILKVFNSEKGKFVLGGRVESGTLVNGATIKVLRRDVEISSGKIKSLQQLKLKVNEVAKDTEFGAMIESKIEPVPGDRIIAFTVSVR